MAEEENEFNQEDYFHASFIHSSLSHSQAPSSCLSEMNEILPQSASHVGRVLYSLTTSAIIIIITMGSNRQRLFTFLLFKAHVNKLLLFSQMKYLLIEIGGFNATTVFTSPLLSCFSLSIHLFLHHSASLHCPVRVIPHRSTGESSAPGWQAQPGWLLHKFTCTLCYALLYPRDENSVWCKVR